MSCIFGCSCVPSGHICSEFPRANVVFLGKVLAGNQNEHGFTHYLVKVEEVFRGLKPEQKEVFIDPWARTSCYSPHEVGKQYLFFAYNRGREATVEESFKRTGYRPQNWPAEWEKKLSLKVYSTGYCSRSTLLENAEFDVEWLRRAVKEKAEERDRAGSWCEVK